MRWIKFKAMHNGSWVYSDSQEDGKLLGAKLGGSLISAFMNHFYGSETLCQYTGREDKNGVSVFEGDIVKSGISEQINVVKFMEGSFAMVHEHHSPCIRHFGMSECEVIGNIHQSKSDGKET